MGHCRSVYALVCARVTLDAHIWGASRSASTRPPSLLHTHRRPPPRPAPLSVQAIDKANEQKVAAKLIQGGGKLATKDIMQRGKELNKEQRRSQVKKKLSRVEEKLRDLKDKAEREGLL